MRGVQWLGACLLGSALGCSLPSDGAGAARPIELVLLNGEALSTVPTVARLLLRGGLDAPLEDLWLVAGSVSSASAARLRTGEVPQVVETARLPLGAWRTSDGVALVPLQVLEPEAEYTLVGLGLGLLGRFTTSAEPAEVWWRWGSGSVAEDGVVAYCRAEPPWALLELNPDGHGVEPLPPGELNKALEPGQIPIELQPGLDDGLAVDVCVRFAPRISSESVLVPPYTFRGAYFEPAPLLFGGALAEAPPPAAEPTIALDGGFGRVPMSAGALAVQVQPEAGAGEGEWAGRMLLVESPAAVSVPLGSFSPGNHLLSWAHLSAGGTLRTGEASLQAGEAKGYPVLMEVLANPAGEEPAGEWVEVQNVGRAPLNLLGYRLTDLSSETVLPAVNLEPGQYGLLVSADFVVSPDLDVVPDAAAVRIVVAELGDGGLRNSGEPLRLWSPTGDLLSSLPARSGETGVSLARRHPLAPDFDASFEQHGAAGASPGRANVFE